MRYKVSVNGYDRRAINKDLTELGTYFNEIPTEYIFDILKSHGLVPLQEDNTEWSGFLCGENEQTYINIGRTNTSVEKDSIVFYEVVENSLLCLSWHLMRPGRWEILTYVT